MLLLIKPCSEMYTELSIQERVTIQVGYLQLLSPARPEGSALSQGEWTLT